MVLASPLVVFLFSLFPGPPSLFCFTRFLVFRCAWPGPDECDKIHEGTPGPIGTLIETKHATIHHLALLYRNIHIYIHIYTYVQKYIIYIYIYMFIVFYTVQLILRMMCVSNRFQMVLLDSSQKSKVSWGVCVSRTAKL